MTKSEMGYRIQIISSILFVFVIALDLVHNFSKDWTRNLTYVVIPVFMACQFFVQATLPQATNRPVLRYIVITVLAAGIYLFVGGWPSASSPLQKFCIFLVCAGALLLQIALSKPVANVQKS